MKKTLTSLAVGALCAAALTTQAAVPTGVLQSFPTQPLAVDWATLNVPGGGGTFATTVALDAAVITNDVAIITNRVVLAAGAAPGGNASAQWSQAGQYLVTRPTGNAYTILLARIQNTGATINGSFPVSYDLGLPSAFAGEDPDIGGQHAYYSFTGAPGSWTPLPELTQVTPAAGGISADLNLGTWASGATLYIIWADDNGGPGTDGSYSIDNFIIGTLPPPPAIVTQPVGVTNLVGRTFTLTVVASGSGLTYSWIKDGNPVDAGANPTAATASLVITNAQELDSGNYSVAISNPQGNVSSVVVIVDIRADGDAPVAQSARVVGSDIIVTFDEALCIDSGVCGSDAQFTFNWELFDTDDQTPLSVDGIVVENGTTVRFAINPATPLVAGRRYTVRVVDIGGGQSGVGDLYGNLIVGGTQISTFPTASFQQGVNGYAGTQDAGIHSATADGPDGANPIINVDGADGGGVRQALLRFEDIFGSNPGQIPSGAIIRSATLRLFQTDNGDVHRLHRMLTGWGDQSTVTWNTLVDGVVADGVEAVAAFDASGPGFNGNNININIDVTASVQAWAAGQANNGWAFIPNGGDGWRWNTSESANPPALLVEYDIVPCVNPPSISAQPPATASVNEGANLSIAVGVNSGGTCALTFQWFKGANPVAGQTSDTLSLVGALPSDGGSYTLRVTNPNGSVTSTAVAVTVVPDTTRPTLTRAIGSGNTTVVLTFSKTLGANASQTARYTFTGGITVSAASVSNNVVTLTTSARPVGNSTLTISGVTDNRASANVIDPNPTTISITTVSVVDAWNSTWSFNTNNLDGAADWTTTGGAGWETGNALFGTETSAGVVAIMPTPIATVIPPNTNTPPDFVTAYFRKTVTLPALGAGQSFALQHMIDDGAIFYLNGVEIGRLNMAAGAATYATKATTAGEAVLLSLPFSAPAGNHVLAVEVHQGGATTSSDILFGAQVVIVPTASPALSIAHVGTNAVVTWNGDASWQLQSSPNAAGPYGAVAGAPFRRFTTPVPAGTTNQFYRLFLLP